MSLCVIGLGQSAAGDDGAGILVIEALRAMDLPGVRCVVARDASALVDLLLTRDTVVVVDAVLAESAGQVVHLDMDALTAGAVLGMSSHGMSVRQAVELAQITEPDRVSSRISFVGITIRRPARFSEGLSAEVADAVQRAKEMLARIPSG